MKFLRIIFFTWYNLCTFIDIDLKPVREIDGMYRRRS